MSKRATDIVAYLTPIGLILAFLFGDREESRFHLNQALVLWSAGVLLNLIVRICGYIPLVGALVAIVGWIINVALTISWIIGFISAITGTEKKIPILGEISLL